MTGLSSAANARDVLQGADDIFDPATERRGQGDVVHAGLVG
jgi:hypothetical protein